MTVTVVFAGGSTRWRVYVDGAHVCSCDREADAVWIAHVIDQLKRGGESLKLEHVAATIAGTPNVPGDACNAPGTDQEVES